MKKRKFYYDAKTSKVTSYLYQINIKSTIDGIDPVIYTNTAPSDVISTLLKKYSLLSPLDFSHSDVVISAEESERLKAVNSVIDNGFDAITNIGEISDFIELGVINTETYSSSLSKLKEDFSVDTSDALLTNLKAALKELRKERLCGKVYYKGKPIHTDNATFKALNEIYQYLSIVNGATVSYRFEDGTFENKITLEDVKGMITVVGNYIQSVWKAESSALKICSSKDNLTLVNIRDKSYKKVFEEELKKELGESK